MNIEAAQKLMWEFAERTGIDGSNPPRRYLWTDAYAVCNFLRLSHATGDRQYLDVARQLVEQVHQILGRHRADDPRSGWISGLPEEAGRQHPTRGGLRIGKSHQERSKDQRFDPQAEWDRDGQYFHYLTKWMHALQDFRQTSNETCYLQWATELAQTAYRAFTYEVGPGLPKRMYWKMSIDLSRPLVTSMGHHDPLDGLVTYLELEHADGQAADLTPAINDFDAMCQQGDWTTSDPLGIGGLLDDAVRLAHLVFAKGVNRRELLQRMLRQAAISLEAVAETSPLSQPAEHRLAFRELGLSIGLRDLPRIAGFIAADPQLAAISEVLRTYQPFAEQIESFWLQPVHQRQRTWTEHQDINSVMLAASLLR